MRLFVAEKPDVAKELSGYLGRKSGFTPKRGERSISVGDDVVTWALGHLLEQAPPDHYFPHIAKTEQNSKNGNFYWSAVPLPIIPSPFEYRPSENKDRAAQLAEIGKLMAKASVIYNAADLDREGQLIFDEIVEYFGMDGRKKIYRLLFSSLDDKSFDRAFASATEINNGDATIRRKGIAAKARSQADWLVGINGTRAMTLAHGSKSTGVMNVGRVIVPTLSIVVRRHLEIAEFKPKAFYTPVIELPDGTVMTWKKRNGDDLQGFDDEGRIIDRAVADRIVRQINDGLDGMITEAKSTEKSQEPPLPYSLPSIQSELSRKYGLTVDEITKACQKLYEKKMQTYVGTDCRFLPEAMHGEARDVLSGLRTQFSGMMNGVDISRKYKCWNDKKLTGDGAAAHHAIIPTGKTGMLESETERIVYDAVCRRYIAQFHPEYRYMSISLQSMFGNDEFSATARIPVSMGWKEIDGDDDGTDDHDSNNNDLKMKANGV
jgi:DNA topoisomerase-3